MDNEAPRTHWHNFRAFRRMVCGMQPTQRKALAAQFRLGPIGIVTTAVAAAVARRKTTTPPERRR